MEQAPGGLSMEYLAVIVGVLVIVLIIGTYNRLVSLRQNVRESWSAIDTELRRRYDLIPNLVEVVKGYATHERDTLEGVIKARNAAISTGHPALRLQRNRRPHFPVLCARFLL